jgi:Fe-S cluster biosynthesis and repair protein YggX
LDGSLGLRIANNSNLLSGSWQREQTLPSAIWRVSLCPHWPICYTTTVSDDKSETPMVNCAKLGKELPAMIYKPFQDELGEKIQAEVSQEAWNQWIEHSKMLVNEYRLDLTSEKAHDTLKEQCRAFLFDEGETQVAADFVPAES